MPLSTSEKNILFSPYISMIPSESCLRLIRQIAHTYRSVNYEDTMHGICLN